MWNSRRTICPRDGLSIASGNVLGFEPSDEEIPDHVLTGAETLLGVRFPDAYRLLIRDYSGSYGGVSFRVDRPTPGFDLSGMGLILSLLPDSADSLYSRMSNWNEHALDPHLIPFGEDSGGNYVCFDYRTSDEPRIVIYFHELAGEEGLMKVCDTFNDFLQRLQLDQDD